VLLFVGGGANNHNLLQEGRPFIMRLRQLRKDQITLIATMFSSSAM
jgi:hypothetical protein